MSKTRKILATLTMVAVTATSSLTAVSSAQADSGLNILWHPHPHQLGPGVIVQPPVPPAPPPKKKGGLKPGQAAAIGVIGGVILGTALANAKKQPAPAQAAGLPGAHYAYCDGKYKTYDPVTNTFMGFDGKRHYCNSPYVN